MTERNPNADMRAANRTPQGVVTIGSKDGLGGWVECSTSLPNCKEVYFVQRGKVKRGRFDHYNGTQFFQSENGSRLWQPGNGVTHWMPAPPMPEPPNDELKNGGQ